MGQDGLTVMSKADMLQMHFPATGNFTQVSGTETTASNWNIYGIAKVLEILHSFIESSRSNHLTRQYTARHATRTDQLSAEINGATPTWQAENDKYNIRIVRVDRIGIPLQYISVFYSLEIQPALK